MGVGLRSKCPCLRAEGQCFWAVFSDMSPETLQRYRWRFHIFSFLQHLPCLRGSVWEAGEWLT